MMEERDNGRDGENERKGSRLEAKHTHTHTHFSLFRGFNEAVRMKNDPVKSNNSTSTLANFPRRGNADDGGGDVDAETL